MGIFSPSSKKIHRDEFRKTLRSIPELSEKERNYVRGVFQRPLKDGLTKEELRKEIQRLKHNPYDPLEPFEVEKIKKKLNERLE